MKRSVATLGFLAAFLVQSGLLFALAADRTLIAWRGEVIRLTVVPVDPRDLFRGDYVTLAYDISRLSTADLARVDAVSEGETVYVTLEQEGSTWKASGVHGAKPSAGLFLRGQVTDRHDERTACETPCGTLRVAYGIERFFVPEGEGRAVEAMRNDRRVEVDVAVARDGRAVLKRLLTDGAVRFDDTLW
ncbi:MAG TPA: GDYXXLXY domain-containing protein [Microvirga sp.]|jgi:uncharacterized membrane-anchored protein|nr:GDYXXLXY domain-containing protein [Microvirga sp.]